MHTDALNTDPDSCPPEVKSRPMKTIYTVSKYQLHDWSDHTRQCEYSQLKFTVMNKTRHFLIVLLPW